MIYFLGNESLFGDFQLATLNDLHLFLEDCRKEGWVSLDLETTGLDFTQDKIVVIGLSGTEHSFVIDFRTHKSSLLTLKPYLESLEVLGANIKFDYKFLKKQGVVLSKVYDVILAERVLYNGLVNISKSLESIALRRLNKQLAKQYSTSYIHIGERPLSAGQIQYAAEDVTCLKEIKELQEEEAKSHPTNPNINLVNAIRLENFVTLAVADMEYNGLKLDKEKWTALYKENLEKVRQLKDALDNIVLTDSLFEKFVPKYVQGDLFQPPKKLDINWNSPAQVLNIFKVIEDSLESVNADILEKYKRKHKIIETYLSYKEFNKRATTYGEDFFKYIRSDGLIHTDYSQIVSTGRLSSKEPNLQNIPADNKFRNCFVPNFPDYVYVSADYNSQELALIAHASKDPVWSDALVKGYDLHSVCAELVFGKIWQDAALDTCEYFQQVGHGNVLVAQKKKCECPKHKVLRTKVKTINFGLAYGMSEHKLSNVLDIPVGEAKTLINAYFRTFPAIRNYLNNSANYAVARGYAETLAPWKRVRFFTGWYKNIKFSRDKQELVGSIERKGKNTPIQGSGGDMTKYAAGHVRKWVHENQAPVFLVNNVHDQLDTICRRDYVHVWVPKFKEIMEKAALSIIPTGVLKAEVNVSDFWTK
jgi:DNA polymerase I